MSMPNDPSGLSPPGFDAPGFEAPGSNPLPSNPTDFLVVHVGGPLDGLIQRGRSSPAALAATDIENSSVGKNVRLGPWYILHDGFISLDFDQASRIREKVGIKPWGKPVYRLEKTDDPKLYKYVYTGQDEDSTFQGVTRV